MSTEPIKQEEEILEEKQYDNDDDDVFNEDDLEIEE